METHRGLTDTVRRQQQQWERQEERRRSTEEEEKYREQEDDYNKPISCAGEESQHSHNSQNNDTKCNHTTQNATTHNKTQRNSAERRADEEHAHETTTEQKKMKRPRDAAFRGFPPPPVLGFAVCKYVPLNIPVPPRCSPERAHSPTYFPYLYHK